MWVTINKTAIIISTLTYIYDKWLWVRFGNILLNLCIFFIPSILKALEEQKLTWTSIQLVTLKWIADCQAANMLQANKTNKPNPQPIFCQTGKKLMTRSMPTVQKVRVSNMDASPAVDDIHAYLYTCEDVE